jgi:hypothetical protein
VAKQQRERITERNRPTRKVVGEDEIAAPAADLRNPIVMIAGATLALTLVLGMWSFFTAEPVPAAPQAPAVEGLPEGFDLEGLDLDAPPVEVIDGSVDEEGEAKDDDASAEEDADEGAEGDADDGDAGGDTDGDTDPDASEDAAGESQDEAGAEVEPGADDAAESDDGDTAGEEDASEQDGEDEG